MSGSARAPGLKYMSRVRSVALGGERAVLCALVSRAASNFVLAGLVMRESLRCAAPGLLHGIAACAER